MNIHGSSVLAGNYRNNRRYVYVKRDGTVKPVLVNWNTGPILEHVPRYQLLWDTSYPSISEAPAVVRQFAIPWNELAHMVAESDGWFQSAVESIRTHTGLDGPDKLIRDTQDELDNRGKAPGVFALHDIREVTVSWPAISAMDISNRDLALPNNMKVSTPTVDLVVTIHRKTGRILRLQSQPYFFPGKPFFDGYFHKRVGRGHSVGMVKILEQLQAGMTVIFNQGIDSQTRANAVFGKTNRREVLDQPIDVAKWIWDPTMKGVEAFNLSSSSFMNIQLLQMLQATAERLSGQSDPAMGRETRLGGHSAPATTTLALLERGNTLAAPDRGLLTNSLSRAGEFIVTLNQQFYDPESRRLEEVLGPLDAAKLREVFDGPDPVATNLHFNIRGLSREDNPDAELQKQIQIAGQTQNYWQSIFSITQGWSQMLQATPPEIQPVMHETFTQALKSLTKTFGRILDAADIDDVENFLLTVNEPGSPTSDLLQSLNDQARQSAGAVQAPPQPGGVGAAGNAAGNGAAGPPGIPGGPVQ